MYTEETPNPLALKFILGRPLVAHGSHLLSSAKEASGIPVLEEIFSLPGIQSVVLTPDFLSITKTEQVPWTLLESVLMSVLHHHLDDFPLDPQNQKIHATSHHDWSHWKPSSEKEAQLYHDIETIVDTMVRPSIEGDGGIITVCGLKEGIVYVQLQGACSSCPHSQETLKGGIENTLKHYIPEVTAVEMIDTI